MLNKIREYINAQQNKQILSFIIILLIIAAVPLTVIVSQQQQEVRQRAAELVSPPSPPFPQSDQDQKQKFAPGEILVKFKTTAVIKVKQEKFLQGIDLDQKAVSVSDIEENTLPSAFGTLDQKYRIKTIEKVFKKIEAGQVSRPEFPKAEQINLSRIYKLELDPTDPVLEIIKELKKDPDVEYAEPNYIVKAQQFIPNDPYFSTSLWGLNNTGKTKDNFGSYSTTRDADIDAPEAWEITKGNDTITVGVIDTGIYYTHPDLIDNIWKNPGETPGNGIDDDNNAYIDDYYGCNFINMVSNVCGDPMDDNNHGTHVAGTIGAVGDNGIGVIGVAPKAKLMALKFLDASGNGHTDDAIKAIYYATMMGVKITNNSWGGGDYSQALYDAINHANSQGGLFVAAAGNGGIFGQGLDTDTFPNYPSSYDLPNIIAVAATDYNDKLAKFSNYGLNSVDLAAPGVKIVSAAPNKHYMWLNGTSMSTSHVSGALALVWSTFPSMSSLEIKNQLLDFGVDKISSLTNKVISQGRLNVYKMLVPLRALLYSRVFIADPLIFGNLGGVTGADSKCEANANITNGLGGTWKAWVSGDSNATSVTNRLYHSQLPYKLLDGTIVANNWDDLTDGTLQHAINLDARRVKIEGFVWTNTNEFGSYIASDSAANCKKWTSYDSNLSAYGGNSDVSTGKKWTHAEAKSCFTFGRLYCFEQPPLTPTPTSTPVNLCTACSSDVNKDGKTNSLDLAILGTCLNKPITGNCANTDINKDGKIDIVDMNCVARNSGQTCIATPTPTPVGFCTACSSDVNKDGKTDSQDLTVLTRCLNRPSTGKCANGDINKNGIVDIVDMNCVARNIDKVCTK